jgi:hypothetical protein
MTIRLWRTFCGSKRVGVRMRSALQMHWRSTTHASSLRGEGSLVLVDAVNGARLAAVLDGLKTCLDGNGIAPGDALSQSVPDSPTQRQRLRESPANKSLNPHSETGCRTDSSLSHFRQKATRCRSSYQRRRASPTGG